MTTMDRLMLWGAAAVMATVGGISVWRTSQTPKVEPWVVAIRAELNRDPRIPRMPAPPPVPVWSNPFLMYIGEPRAISDRVGEVPPRVIGEGVKHPAMDVLVLPNAVVGAAKSNLDGAAVSWTVAEPPKEKLEVWQTQKTAKPSGFLVRRQCGDGPVQDLARTGPEARSFADLSTLPKRTYRYWVLVFGEETVRTSYPAVQEPVTKGLGTPAETRTPTATRMKLVGGDKTTAILRVETYDRSQKKWIPKTAQTAPGRDIGSSGWSLKGLRFDNFTLVADVTDDEGVDRVLTTKD